MSGKRGAESRLGFLGWYGLMIFGVVAAIVCFGVCCAAALADSNRLGNLGMTLLLGSTASMSAAGIWKSEAGKPEWRHGLPRVAKAQIRKERERIALDRAIRESERALGWSKEDEWER